MQNLLEIDPANSKLGGGRGEGEDNTKSIPKYHSFSCLDYRKI